MNSEIPLADEYVELAQQIKAWGTELGFQQVGISDPDLSQHEAWLQGWLERNYHGSMEYMAAHGNKRSRPQELLPGTLRIISVRLDYRVEFGNEWKIMADSDKAYISRYALGRDYHKLLRKRLTQLAQRIREASTDFQGRPFVDSAPVLERAIAERSGLGWIGKNTMLINSRAGSWFFLGELFTNLPLPVDPPQTSKHCGSCRACLDVCPTQAFVGPFELDARRCISYLTIESRDPIPVELRSAMGNRIFGCDDCQLVCPWNKFAGISGEADFQPRHGLQDCELLDLFAWDEASFLKRTEGSALRRIGHERWLRNIAVALGNAEPNQAIVDALTARLNHPSDLVREHVEWALDQQQQKFQSI